MQLLIFAVILYAQSAVRDVMVFDVHRRYIRRLTAVDTVVFDVIHLEHEVRRVDFLVD